MRNKRCMVIFEILRKSDATRTLLRNTSSHYLWQKKRFELFGLQNENQVELSMHLTGMNALEIKRKKNFKRGVLMSSPGLFKIWWFHVIVSHGIINMSKWKRKKKRKQYEQESLLFLIKYANFCISSLWQERARNNEQNYTLYNNFLADELSVDKDYLSIYLNW